jgi:selenocysteine lyase/cysteine desulfurase
VNDKPKVPPVMSLTDYIGNADEFPVLRKWDFYNHAAVSPIPRVAGEAFRKYAAEAETGAYLDTTWYRDVEALRTSAAAMLNADRSEIALVKNTSEGIATIACGIDWRAGDRIVTAAVEYPANMYPWMDVARRFGVELVTVPERTGDDGARRVELADVLEAATHPRTRLVTLSHVEFGSGQRLDIAAVGRFCRERGKLFCVDAIQTMGALPVDVVAMNIDFLSADGHKWLLGPEGAGVMYCRKDLLPQVRPLVIGWMNVVHAQDFGHYDFTLKPDAAKFECGSWNVPGFLAFKASLELLAGAGIEAIAARLKALTDRLIPGLQQKGYAIVSPRRHTEWSGSVSFVSPDPRKHDQIVRTLRKEHRIEIALRVGRLRASPHFYNTEAQIDRLIDVLPRS